jgi:protein transport protein SEC24
MNMNGGMQPPSKPKIDPSQIPRPPLFTSPQDGTEHIPIYYPKEALHHAEPRPPPPADSRFLTFDDGNAAPQLIRSTVYAIPMDRQVLRHSLPMGFLCTPLSIASAEYVPRHKVLPDGELQEWRDAQRIPLVSQQVVPKCRHCHAYANPYWGQDGICNFCQTRNSSLQLVGFTTKYGTVEYEVGGPYITRKTPVQPVFLYAIDATCPNLPLYIPMLCNVGKSMAQHYQRQGAGRLAPRIATCLVGSFGIVLCTLETNGSISLSVMSDVTEQPFSPLPLEQWTFDMSSNQSVQHWEMLTNQLWNAWQPFIKELDQKSPYGPNGFSLSCGGAALAFMADALAETGGRATLLTWRRPNFGVGAIRDREQMNTSNYTSEKTERTLYTPLQIQKDLKDKVDVNSATFYKELGATCAKNRVCIDILVHTPPTVVPFLDLGTLGELCRITSGRIKWIRSRRWKEQLQEELQRSVLSFVGRDAVFKVRCSEGLHVKSYLSCTAPGVTMENGIAESPELEMTCVDPTTCIAVDLEHRVGGIRKDAQIVYFQSALLYTTSAGERRVRVSTLALRTTKEPTTVFRSADFSAITTLMTRKTITNLWQPISDIEIPLQEARVDVTMQCIDILSNYRRYTSAHALPIGQLILPDRLQLLPLYCMSLLKSVMLRSSLPKRGSGVRVVKPSPTADERAYGLFFGSSVIPALAMLLVHPHVFPILHLQDGDGEWQIPEYSLASSEIEKAAAHAYIQLPAPVNPSITCLDDNGVYLIDDGFTIFVYLGKDVPEDVSGPLLIKDVDGNYAVSNDSAFGKQIRRLIWQMQTFCAVGEGSESCLRPTVAPVEVVLGDENHNKDPLEEKVMTLMVDDSSSTEHDYIDFLVQIHKSVRSKTQDS